MWECWRHWGEAGVFSWGSLFMVTCVCACPGASYLGRIGLRDILAMARTHFTILICSRGEWILLHVIPIRRLHQLLIRNPGLETKPRIYRILTPSAFNTIRAYYTFVHASTQSATTEARKNGIFPWRGVRRQPKPDDHSHLWKYVVLAELGDKLETLLK